MRYLEIPVLNENQNVDKLSFTEGDFEQLIDELYALRKTLLYKGIDAIQFILPPKSFLLFKYGCQYLSKYSSPQYIEFKHLKFCGIGVVCGTCSKAEAIIDDKDSTRALFV